jgi:hypothetical protein
MDVDIAEPHWMEGEFGNDGFHCARDVPRERLSEDELDQPRPGHGHGAPADPQLIDQKFNRGSSYLDRCIPIGRQDVGVIVYAYGYPLLAILVGQKGKLRAVVLDAGAVDTG